MLTLPALGHKFGLQLAHTRGTRAHRVDVSACGHPGVGSGRSQLILGWYPHHPVAYTPWVCTLANTMEVHLCPTPGVSVCARECVRVCVCVRACVCVHACVRMCVCVHAC